MNAPTAAQEVVTKPRKTRAVSRLAAAARASFVSPQMSLFGDDPFGAMATIELMETAQQQVDTAIAANPAILVAVAHAQQPEALAAREGLDFARFMRNAGLPQGEVAKVLDSAGQPAGVVLEQLRQVEQVVGAGYPAKVVAELADDVELDESSLDADFEVDTLDVAELEGDVGFADANVEDLPSSEELTSGFEGAAKTTKKPGDDAVGGSALVALMRRIRGKRYEPITIDQENALAARIQAGDVAARNELCDHNMRFLVLMAKRFTYTGRPMDFLISAGTTGLIKATEKFDPARGRFTTCAALWIRQGIQRALLGDNLMKTPAYLPAKASKLHKEADAATDPVEKARLTAEAANVDREVKARRSRHVSLDGGQDDDSDSGGGLHNMFAAESAGPEELMEKRQLVSQLVKAAMALTNASGQPDPRGRDIFLLRVGLHEDHIGEPQTLAEVAEVFDISRERVRQIYTEAAIDVANAVQVWARGADNLPPGFRKSLVSPGR